MVRTRSFPLGQAPEAWSAEGRGRILAFASGPARLTKETGFLSPPGPSSCVAAEGPSFCRPYPELTPERRTIGGTMRYRMKARGARKYSLEFKKQALKDRLDGVDGVHGLARKYGIDHRLILGWAKRSSNPAIQQSRKEVGPWRKNERTAIETQGFARIR